MQREAGLELVPRHFLTRLSLEGRVLNREEDRRCGELAGATYQALPSSLSVLTNHFFQISHQKQTPVVVIGWLP